MQFRTMKKLYLVRHAKSSWDQGGIRDFERPLTNLGIKRSKKVIEYLKSHQVKIDLMISSPAVRTHETARLFANGLDYQIESIRLQMEVYEAYADHLLEIIRSTEDEVTSLMLVGHNPAMTHLANIFLTEKIENLPTTGVAAFSFPVKNWNSIITADPTQLFCISPKSLK